MRHYLVTGGAGFIGSHIVQALLEGGNFVPPNQRGFVRVLDNFSTGRRENLLGMRGSLEVLEGDLRDPARMREAVRDIEVIFHEAAFVSAPQSMTEPQSCFDVNVGGTEILLEAARQARVRRVVLASSAAVYGDSDALPLSEDTILQPLSPYAASKQIGEIYAGLYSRSFGLEVVALRYFNVFGPRQSPDTQYAAAVPIFIRRLLAGQPVLVYGDGGQTRDLIYIQDVVRANLLAADHPQAVGQVCNICTGHETRISDLVETLMQLFPTAPPPQYAPPRPGDIYRSVGDSQRAAATLGFRAQTRLADGLRQTMEWMRQ
jgi:nucleoside-diphosphate-sugar epimerase